MGVRVKRCQSTGKSFLKWNLSLTKGEYINHLSYHTLRQGVTNCCSTQRFTSIQVNPVERVIFGVSPRDACVQKKKNRFGGAHATSRSFSFRGREQYIHCVAGIWVDRTAAGSGGKERERILVQCIVMCPNLECPF